MKEAIVVVMLLAGGLMAAPRISVGFGFGTPTPVAVAPPRPGPGYAWVDGCYAPDGVWVAGYCPGDCADRSALRSGSCRSRRS